MKFYCIDTQRFTVLTDDSIRELLSSSRLSQRQVRRILWNFTSAEII